MIAQKYTQLTNNVPSLFVFVFVFVLPVFFPVGGMDGAFVPIFFPSSSHLIHPSIHTSTRTGSLFPHVRQQPHHVIHRAPHLPGASERGWWDVKREGWWTQEKQAYRHPHET